MAKTLRLGSVEIELKTRGTQLLGLGRIRIGGQVVRNGELPLRPFTATHDGIEYDRFELGEIEESGSRIVLHTKAVGVSAVVSALQDHSLDPVWCTRPWDGRTIAEDRFDWILEPATRLVGGRSFDGFVYSFRFHSKQREIYYILDRATWELDGRAEGITLLRQQMGEDPLVTLRGDTDYSTSACIGYPINPVMTHDVPRWASEQGFDYQYRNGDALIGMFAHCSLIRTIVTRGPGDTAIRHFDKHIFDQTGDAGTVPKFIGLARGVGDDTDQLNAWTRVFDDDQDRILGEFGMHRTYNRTTLSHNFWHGFTAESYRDDLLPAAAALGFQQVFIDPFWENDMTRTRDGKLPKGLSGNMCCPHEYEIAKVLGGAVAYRRLARDARKLGVDLISWVGSHQSTVSPYLLAHGAEIIKGPDGRHNYGSGYDWIYGMDIASPFGPMFRDAVIRGAKAGNVAGFLYDSFYNFGWMPTNFHTPDPADPTNIHKGALKVHTQWRQLCEIMAAWQKAGIHMFIESLGPWGQPQHGVQGAYNRIGAEALAYQCAVSVGYSVIPTPNSKASDAGPGPEFYYRLLACKAPNTMNLWVTGKDGKRARLDQVAHPIVRQGNLDYRAVLPLMHTRTVLHGEAGVVWVPNPEQGKREVLFSYRKQTFPSLAGTSYVDVTAGAKGVAGAKGIPAAAFHTYIIG